MQGKTLRRLFFLSLVAASGLLALQFYWIQQHWKDTESFLSRQLNFSFHKAVEEESRIRTDSFYNAMRGVILDEKFFFYTYEDTRSGLRITMHSASDPKDVIQTHISMNYRGIKDMTPDSIRKIVRNDVWNELKANFLNDYVHIMYGRSYESMYWKYFNELKLDSLRLQDLLTKELQQYRITEHPFFAILPRDQAKRRAPNTIYTDTIAIDFTTVKDSPRKYKIVAFLPALNQAIVRRAWMSWLSCILLVGLTLFCLYRMYNTLIRQKQLDEMKNDFISNMTHELKTPVATIRAAVDGLQYFGGLKDPEKTDRYLDVSRVQLERLDQIITAVLNTTVYERKQVALKKSHIPLKATLEEIVESFRTTGDVLFSHTLNCDATLHVSADPFHFSNAIRNILDNAIKYVPGKRKLQIRCEAFPEKIGIHIQDNGPGIPTEQLIHIFQKFYRVPSGNVHNVKGFGIGLFYVRQIVEQHGGSAMAASKPGDGTTISLFFPTEKSPEK